MSVLTGMQWCFQLGIPATDANIRKYAEIASKQAGTHALNVAEAIAKKSQKKGVSK